MDTYEVVRLLGVGGVGRVYEAVRVEGLGAGRRVAIKLLHGEHKSALHPGTSTLQRFRDEARILSMVRDRAVVWADVPIQFDVGWGVVMDLAPGANAAVVHRTCGAFPIPAVLELVCETARALQNLWTSDGPDGPLHVIHRDLKPSNLQLSPSGEVRILDFGNARADFAAREAKTTRHIGGTPGYMAPERLAGQEGPEGDVFSLGVVLGELAVGPSESGMRHTPATLPLLARSEQTQRTGAQPAAGHVDLPDAVVALVAAMTGRSQARPTAQQVARQCRELLRKVQGESLMDWTERAVPAAARRLAPDAVVGATLTVLTTSAKTDA